jgi:16S rRNA (uracil1498-N3)-methyltransferase
MPRYFVPNRCVTDGFIRIEGQTARHIAVSRRAKIGDVTEVVDESANAYKIRLEVVTDGEVAGEIIERYQAGGEPSLKVTLLQAIAKEGMDEAIDAATELGVDRIVPVVTEHTVVRLDAQRASARHRHWQEVALSAAEVAYRGRVPAVEAVATLAQGLEELPQETRVLACAMTEDARPLSALTLSASRPLALVIGPEGGLSASDLRSIASAGGERVHLGPRVLRARVAASHALAICMAITRDLESRVQQDTMR